MELESRSWALVDFSSVPSSERIDAPPFAVRLFESSKAAFAVLTRDDDDDWAREKKTSRCVTITKKASDRRPPAAASWVQLGDWMQPASSDL